MASKKTITLRSLDRCNQQLDTIFERLDMVDESLFHAKIDAETWSVIQILKHLQESEEMTLKYLNYKIEEGTTFKKESLKTKLTFRTAMFLYNFPIKFKAPTKLAQPSKELDIESMKNVYVQTRTDIEAFIKSQPEEFFQLASCKHPRIGRLSMHKMVRFFHKHVSHHEKQILRRLIKLSK